MNVVVRCKRCHRKLVANRCVTIEGSWHLCPHCRGPLPATDSVPSVDHGTSVSYPTEVAP